MHLPRESLNINQHVTPTVYWLLEVDPCTWLRLSKGRNIENKCGINKRLKTWKLEWWLLKTNSKSITLSDPLTSHHISRVIKYRAIALMVDAHSEGMFALTLSIGLA